jgi:ABC-2 type transport system permease protein
MRRAVHAEWTKLRTVPGPGWLAIGLVVLTIGITITATTIVKCPASCQANTTKLSLTGLLFGQSAVAALAVLAITAEYSTGMIRMSLAAVPHRTVLLAAKAVVVTAVVLVAGGISVLGSLAAGLVLLPGSGFTVANRVATLSFGHVMTVDAAGGAVLYLILVGLFSLGLATAVRDSGASTAILLGLMFALPIIAEISLSPVWQHRVERWAPLGALPASLTGTIDSAPAGWWPGLGVLGLWTAGALLAGWLVLRLRDA